MAAVFLINLDEYLKHVMIIYYERVAQGGVGMGAWFCKNTGSWSGTSLKLPISDSVAPILSAMPSALDSVACSLVTSS